jgi:hypothetical protein
VPSFITIPSGFQRSSISFPSWLVDGSSTPAPGYRPWRRQRTLVNEGAVQAAMAPRLADGQGRFALHQMRKVDRSLTRRIGAGVAPWVVCWAMMASWMC